MYNLLGVLNRKFKANFNITKITSLQEALYWLESINRAQGLRVYKLMKSPFKRNGVPDIAWQFKNHPISDIF